MEVKLTPCFSAKPASHPRSHKMSSRPTRPRQRRLLAPRRDHRDSRVVNRVCTTPESRMGGAAGRAGSSTASCRQGIEARRRMPV